MFAHVHLPDFGAVSRRTDVMTITVAVVALGVILGVGNPYCAVGAVVGLGLGLLNFHMAAASVIRIGERPEKNKRRPLAVNTMGRMAVITVIAFILVVLKFWLGAGVLGGLAAFQLLHLANIAGSMFKMGALTHDAAIDATATDTTDTTDTTGTTGDTTTGGAPELPGAARSTDQRRPA